MYRQWLSQTLRDPPGLLPFIKRGILGADRVPIVSTSMGRVGSTLLYNSLVDGRLNSIFGTIDPTKRPLLATSCWNLNELRWRPAAIYKSHDLPPIAMAPKRVRIVFLYGTPSDVALSLVRAWRLKGREWMLDHFLHMHAIGTFDELLERDVLQLGIRLSTWPNYRGAETLCLRYEALWNKLEVLEEFVGFRVQLPPWKKREFSDIDPAVVDKARSTYRALDEVASKLPDVRWTVPDAQNTAEGRK
jgi:hypothetical protein